MKRSSFYILLCAILFSAGCRKEWPAEKVVADFDCHYWMTLYDSSYFYNKSFNNIYYYDWNFGDGTRSNAPSRFYRYNTNGAYTVKLKVYNYDRDLSDSTERTIHIGHPYLSECVLHSFDPYNAQTGKRIRTAADGKYHLYMSCFTQKPTGGDTVVHSDTLAVIPGETSKSYSLSFSGSISELGLKRNYIFSLYNAGINGNELVAQREIANFPLGMPSPYLVSEINADFDIYFDVR